MADLVQTAANVVPVLGAIPPSILQGQTILAGETITAGQPVYRKAADGLRYKADANASSESAKAEGFAIAPSAAGQPISIQTGGDINIGATLVPGTFYGPSATAGAVAPNADMTSLCFPCIMGQAISTTVLRMANVFNGVAIP